MPVTVMHSIRTLSLVGLLVLLAACSGAGPAFPTDSPPAATVAPIESLPGVSPSRVSSPSSQPPSASSGVTSITTAEGAVAAVVAERPQFAGYRIPVLLPGASASPGAHGRPAGGIERSVLAERLEAGFRLIFVTGSGDCESGCTVHRYDVFVVHADGIVEPACVLDQFPFGRDPCAPG
jgi:hypothetical protein